MSLIKLRQSATEDELFGLGFFFFFIRSLRWYIVVVLVYKLVNPQATITHGRQKFYN